MSLAQLMKRQYTFLSGKDVIGAIKNIQVPSIEGLAKTTEVESTYAKKTELPDISNLAVKTEVVTKMISN